MKQKEWLNLHGYLVENSLLFNVLRLIYFYHPFSFLHGGERAIFFSECKRKCMPSHIYINHHVGIYLTGDAFFVDYERSKSAKGSKLQVNRKVLTPQIHYSSTMHFS